MSSANSRVVNPVTSGTSVRLTAGTVGNTTITITARDPGGLSAMQLARINVVPTTAYEPLRELTITLTGRLRLGSLDIGTSCVSTPGDGITIDGTLFKVHWMEWQFRTSPLTIYTLLPGTRTNGQLCGRDLTNAPPGEYRLVGVMSIDGGRRRIRSNNTIDLRPSGAPDLAFTGVSPTVVNVSPGETAMATFTLRNRGTTASAATTARLFQSDDATISTADNELGVTSIGAIAAGAEVPINVSLTLPTNAPSGTFYAGACVDAVAGELNTANNCSQALRIVVSTDSGSPDLIAESASPSSQTVAQGNVATADFFLRNGGGGPSSSTTVRVLVSADATISTTDGEIGTHTLSGLEANESYTLTVNWTLPSNQALATIYWGVCIDPVAGESNTTNNCSPSVQLTVVGSGASSSQSSSSVSGAVEVIPGRAAGSRARSPSDWLSRAIIRIEVIGREE